MIVKVLLNNKAWCERAEIYSCNSIITKKVKRVKPQKRGTFFSSAILCVTAFCSFAKMAYLKNIHSALQKSPVFKNLRSLL